MLLHLKKWCVKITYYIAGSTCGQYEASPVISLATQASKFVVLKSVSVSPMYVSEVLLSFRVTVA